MLLGIAGLKALALGAILLHSTFWPVPKTVESGPDLVLLLPCEDCRTLHTYQTSCTIEQGTF